MDHGVADTVSRMRLREMLVRLDTHLPALAGRSLENYPLENGKQGLKLRGSYSTLRAALESFFEMDALKGFAEASGSDPVFRAARFSDEDAVYGSVADMQRLAANLAALQTTAIALSGALRQCVTKEEPTTFNVKLPSRISSIGDLVELAKDFEVIFDGPLRVVKLEPPTIVGFDSGSLWLVLLAYRDVVFTILWDLVKFAAKTVYRKLEVARAKRTLEAIGGDPRVIAGIEENLAKEMGRIAQAGGVEIQVKVGGPPEAVARFALAIKRLSELMADGLEVHPALEAPATLVAPEDAKILRRLYEDRATSQLEQGPEPKGFLGEPTPPGPDDAPPASNHDPES